MRIMVCMALCTALLGCATVHQPPGIDPEMLTRYTVSDSGFATVDSLGTKVKFALSMGGAVDAVAAACFDLRIPMYYPIFSSDRSEAFLVSGPFIAQCKIDCDCSSSGVSGHAADLASGTFVVKITKGGLIDEGDVIVEVSSMFSRTQSSGGEYGSTSNLYFRSLGRVEKHILSLLAEAERREVM